MASAKEFLDYAEECLDWARTARSEREREIFLQVTRTWMEAATLATGKLLAASNAVVEPAEADNGGNATV